MERTNAPCLRMGVLAGAYVLSVACVAACLEPGSGGEEGGRCPVQRNEAGGEAFDPCIRSCWTPERQARCCRDTHSAVGTDPDAAVCLAQSYGLSPTKDSWVAVMERFEWMVASTVEDECDFPNHAMLHLIALERQTGAFQYETWATLTTMAECTDP